MSRETPSEALELPTLLTYTARDRAKALVRAAFPKRRWHVITVRDFAEFDSTLRHTLVDAAVIDIGSAPSAAAAGGEAPAGSARGTDEGIGDDAWRMAGLAQEYPTAPFFGITPLRATDAPAVARCVALDFCDVIADGIDDTVAREMVGPAMYTSRFVAALREPPPSLGLRTPMQLKAWRSILAFAGRPVRTARLASDVGVSREHLSRHFSAPSGPNLKRVIDLVRMIGAAQLAKNPGLDLSDVATILGFASSSHLAVTAQRVLGARPASLSRLRTIDLIERFTHGRTRSRG